MRHSHSVAICRVVKYTAEREFSENYKVTDDDE
jgi:hypothetical protein